MKKIKIKDLNLFISDGNYSSKYPRSEEFKEQGIPFIRCNNFKNNSITSDDMYYITEKKHAELLKGHLKTGDVLITTRGSLGQVVIVPKEYNDANINAQIVLLRSDESIINNRYLMWQLKSTNVKNQIQRNQTGTALQQLPVSKLKEIELNIEEDIVKQKEITTIFDKLDETIALRKKQLEQLDELIKSQFVEMFGNPIFNEKNWKKNKLGLECNIITGNTPSRNRNEYYGDYIEWIKSDNINTSSNYITKAEEYLSREGEKVGRTIEKDSILMTCIAGSIGCIGNVAITDRKVAFNQQINGIETLKNNTVFMYVQFLLSKKYIQSTINMSLKGILSKGKLSELEFIFPPIELQNQFAEIVKQIDKQKFEIQNLFDSY